MGDRGCTWLALSKQDGSIRVASSKVAKASVDYTQHNNRLHDTQQNDTRH
jgi:hypothetical protein